MGIAFGHPNGWDKPAGYQSYILNIQANQAVTSSNNSYFATLAEAGISSDADFKLINNSPLQQKGKNIANILEDDYYGTKRSQTPSIGAVE
ncbi:hypothetical protein D3C86_1807350 [compost metagenome]